jgi:hypothetical protein
VYVYNANNKVYVHNVNSEMYVHNANSKVYVHNANSEVYVHNANSEVMYIMQIKCMNQKIISKQFYLRRWLYVHTFWNRILI